jgi:hypothetical protein
MAKPLELRRVLKILRKYGVLYITGRGRHPKFYDPESHRSYPIKSHGKKTDFAVCTRRPGKEI